MAELLDEYVAEWRTAMLDVADYNPAAWDVRPSEYIYNAWAQDSGYYEVEEGDEAEEFVNKLFEQDKEMGDLVTLVEARYQRENDPDFDPDEVADESRREAIRELDKLIAELDDWDDAQLNVLWAVHNSFLQQ